VGVEFCICWFVEVVVVVLVATDAIVIGRYGRRQQTDTAMKFFFVTIVKGSRWILYWSHHDVCGWWCTYHLVFVVRCLDTLVLFVIWNGF